MTTETVPVEIKSWLTGEVIYTAAVDVDAPAPKASGTDWIVRWSCENGYTRSAALHHTEIAAVALANFLRETGRTHVSVTRADWEDGQGLQPEGGR